MALMYVPPRQNAMQNQMFSVLSNLMFQKMAFNQKMQIADKKLKQEEILINAQLKREQQKEVRGFKAKGWREPEAQEPVIEIGDTGLVPPQTGMETQEVDVGGQKGTVAVETMTPYGGQKQVTDVGAIKTIPPKSSRPIKIEQFDPKTGLTDIYLAENVGGKWQVGNKPVGRKPPTGLKFKKEGENFTLVSGGMGQQGTLTKASTTQAQKDIMSLNDQKGLLESAMQTVKPHYMKWETKGLMYLRGLQDKAAGLIPGVKELTDTERKELREFTTFRSSSGEHFAKTVHALAKGTLTKHESRNYGSFVANSRKDSPTEYMAKLRQNYEGLQKSLARKHYYLNVLNTPASTLQKKLNKNTVMSLAEFDTLIDKKFEEELIRQRTVNPNAPYEEVKEKTLKIIEASFFGF